MKRYKVWLEYRITDTLEVEAESEKEAESKAMEGIEVGPRAEYVDSRVTVLPDKQENGR